MNKSKILIAFSTIVITVLFIRCSESSRDELKNTPINVETKFVSNINIDERFSYSGTIEESESTPVCFSNTGTVSRVYVSEGDYVKKRQLLAELNDETYKNTYEMTLATLQQAEDAYNRLKPMYENGNLPEIKYVEVETSLQRAKSAEEIAKKTLDDCKLYSPVDGVIGKRSVDPGMIAMPNITSINIVKIEKVFARVPVSETEIALIKKGDKAVITIAALNNAKFSGIVEEIGVIADPLAHTYKIKIGIPNKDLLIKPGMICSVTIEKSKQNKGLFIPSQAVLVDEQGKNFVFVVNQNRAIRKYVITGKLLKDGVDINEGLKAGQQIVIAGQQKLVDSSLVRVVK